MSLFDLFRWWDAHPPWAPEQPGFGEAEESRTCRSLADDGFVRALSEVADVQDAAAVVRYGNGKNKRTRYPRVDLSRRRVVIVLHQTGVERGEDRWRRTAHKITCHRAVGPTGVRYRVHPLDVRLVAANRVDRAPWHAISIEVCGNFEGTHGKGNWYKPDVFGHGKLGLRQMQGARAEIRSLILDEVPAIGGRVEAIIPHRTTGRGRNGKPNRPICPGSAAWSLCGEWAGATFGVAVPGPDWSLGGLTVPREWHGDYWAECRSRLE